MIKHYGKCGNACEICMHFDSGCKGCQIENESDLIDYNCVIYKCAIEKNVQSCFSCGEYPCKLVTGISKSYCPVHALKIKKLT